MKKTLLALLCAGLCLLSSCAKDVDDPDAPESTPVGDETGDVAEEKGAEGNYNFAYISEHYSADGDTVVADQISKYASKAVYGGAFVDYPDIGEYYIADIHFNFDNMNSTAGIVFGAKAATDFDGFTGYAFMVWEKYAYLYEVIGSPAAGMKTTLLASRTIEAPDSEEGVRLRVERDKNTYRLYYLDDMEGVEPWPEFEYLLKYADGTGIGFIDDGHGVTFDSLSVTAYTPEDDSDVKTYKNPVYTAGEAADPYVLKYDGMYYCYATNAPNGYYVYQSSDMVNWKNAGLCCRDVWTDKISDPYYWAPEVVEYNGKFYMIVSVSEHIGFAVADSPLGPFVAEKTWLFSASIDGHVFFDTDGTPYLYYVRYGDGREYGIYGCQLGEDLVSVVPGTEKLLIKPQDTWETKDAWITEGPAMLEHNGTYYLSYSGSDYQAKSYAVGYATSDSPLGEYTRYEANPILSYTSKVYGPGHHSFTTSPDGSELFIVYHAHRSTTAVHPRTLCIDRIRFAETESGIARLEIWGPTYTSQEYPK